MPVLYRLYSRPYTVRTGLLLNWAFCRCNGTVKFVIARDPQKQFKFCALQSRAAQPLFDEFGLTRSDALKSIILIQGDQFYQRSEAAIRIAQGLPWPYPAMGVFLGIPQFIRDAVYDLIGSNRYLLFGQSDECLAPTQATLSRFVDGDEYREKAAAEARARRLAKQGQKAEVASAVNVEDSLTKEA